MSPLSLSTQRPTIKDDQLNVFESDQSWAAGEPGVRGVQLALKGGGSHGMRSGRGQA